MMHYFRSGQSQPAWVQRVLNALRPHKTLLAIGFGFALQWSAVQFAVSRPLHQQLARVEVQLGISHEQMESLADMRGTAHQANDLLSALQAQQATLSSAEQALADVRQLRIDLEQEARLTGAASDQLQQLGNLQRELSATGKRTDELALVLTHLTQLNERIADLKAPTEQSLGYADQADQALSQINRLQSRLAEQSAGLPAAEQSLDAALKLQASLALAAPDVKTAQANADRLVEIALGLNTVEADTLTTASDRASDLLAIHDLLSDAEALRIEQAEHNLRTLMATQAELLRSTPEIAAAAENLELLTDFQTELNRQIQGLETLRKELTEVALLKETISRVSEAVRPLAEMSDLRRLDADQVRAMAREILDRRTAQLPAAEGSAESIGPSSPLREQGIDVPVPSPMDP